MSSVNLMLQCIIAFEMNEGNGNNFSHSYKIMIKLQ